MKKTKWAVVAFLLMAPSLARSQTYIRIPSCGTASPSQGASNGYMDASGNLCVTTPPFLPSSAQIPFTASTTSSNTTLPVTAATAGVPQTVVVTNPAGGPGAWVALGTSNAVTATTAAPSIYVAPGASIPIPEAAYTYIAAITSTGSTTLTLQSGSGSPSSITGGSVTIVDGGDVTQGTTTDAAWSGTGAGTLVAILKASYAKLSAMATSLAGTLTVTVDGYETAVVSTPTVQNASYVSGNCVGSFNAISLASFNGGSGFLQNVTVASKTGVTPTLTIYLFNANPTASTCTDKGTFTVNAADVGKLIGAPFAVGLAAPTGTTVTWGAQANLGLPFVAGGSSGSGVETIYYALVSGTTFTPGSTADLVVTVGASVR